MLESKRDARRARRIAYTVLHWRAIALFTGAQGRHNHARMQLPFALRHDPHFLFQHGVLWVDRWRLRRGEIEKLEHGHPYGRRG